MRRSHPTRTRRPSLTSFEEIERRDRHRRWEFFQIDQRVTLDAVMKECPARHRVEAGGYDLLPAGADANEHFRFHHMIGARQHVKSDDGLVSCVLRENVERYSKERGLVPTDASKKLDEARHASAKKKAEVPNG